MTELIRVYGWDEPIHRKMESIAAMLELRSPRKCIYTVGETYFDYGQDWRWTTILREDPVWGSVQVLTPRDLEMIAEADDTAESLRKVVEFIVNGDYFNDK